MSAVVGQEWTGDIGDAGAGLSPAERQVWAAARLIAVTAAPYLATAVLAVQPVADAVARGVDPELLRAFPVDSSWRMHLDPSVMATTPPRVLAFWLLHHVGHLLRGHAARALAAGVVGTGPGESRSPGQQRWGLAADCEVNDDLPPGLRPAGEPHPAALGLAAGHTAEQYVAALAAAAPGLAGGGLVNLLRDCGSGGDGVARRWESGSGVTGIDAEQSRLLQEHAARAVAAYARDRGGVPAGWRRWALEVTEPVVAWRRELSGLVRHGAAACAGRVDYTYRRRSRRAAASPQVVLAALSQPQPRVCVLLDTSQSMTPSLLAAALGEISGVCRSLGVGPSSLRLLCCDTTVTEAARTLQAGETRLVGGGGTDLRVGFAAAQALRPRPGLLVVLTDGATPWPERPPRGLPVVVGILDSDLPAPGWARTVRIGEAGR